MSLQSHLETLTGNFKATFVRFGVLGFDNIKICAIVEQNDRTVTWAIDKGCKKFQFDKNQYIHAFNDVIKSLLILTQESAKRYQRTLFCDDLELLYDTVVPSPQSSLVLDKKSKKKKKKLDKEEMKKKERKEGVSENEKDKIEFYLKKAKQNKIVNQDKKKSYARKTEQTLKMQLHYSYEHVENCTENTLPR